MSKNKNKYALYTTLKLVYSALYLALSIVLPTVISMGSQKLGQTLLPMHIPVMLCGFTCGAPYGMAIGFIAPLLKCILTGLPQMNTAIAMAFELAAYGLTCGLLYKIFPKKMSYIYPTLIISMILGRVLNAIIHYLLSVSNDNEFILKSFITLTTINAVPGIIIQLAIIPLVILALRKTKFMLNE